MKKHYSIPVFVPHLGCQNECVFCDQEKITGQTGGFDEGAVRRTIEKFLGIIKNRIGINPVGTEIAFFGGSFTGLKREHMTRLLEIAGGYMERCEMIGGIRVSTRPDCISPEIVDILLRYNVKSVELGIQSMSDEVLAACKRGHTAKDTKKACGAIKSAGLQLTGQMMLGLPKSSREIDIKTAEEMADLGVGSARVYPTVVLQGTRLYSMYKSGEYEPITLDEAVFRAKEVKKVFDKNNIKILRMGLCASENINTRNCIGPYHPAFGELVEGELIYDDIQSMGNDPLVVRANKKFMSKVAGHGGKNAKRLKNVKIIEDNSVESVESYETCII